MLNFVKKLRLKFCLCNIKSLYSSLSLSHVGPFQSVQQMAVGQALGNRSRKLTAKTYQRLVGSAFLCSSRAGVPSQTHPTPAGSAAAEKRAFLDLFWLLPLVFAFVGYLFGPVLSAPASPRPHAISVAPSSHVGALSAGVRDPLGACAAPGVVGEQLS